MSNDKPLNRRSFVATVGSIGIAALAGCSNSGDSQSSPTKTSVDTRSTTPTSTETTESPTATPTETSTPISTPEYYGEGFTHIDKDGEWVDIVENRDKWTGRNITVSLEYGGMVYDHHVFFMINDRGEVNKGAAFFSTGEKFDSMSVKEGARFHTLSEITKVIEPKKDTPVPVLKFERLDKYATPK